MKLLYVIHQYFPDCHSGTEQYCLAASREARRRGHDVTVLSLHWEWGRDEPPLHVFEAPYDGFRVIRLNHWIGLAPSEPLRDHLDPIVGVAFRRILAEVQPDAVHVFHLRQLGIDVLDACVEARVPTIVNLMDFWFLCPRFTLLRSDGTLCEGPPDGGFGCVPCAHPAPIHGYVGADHEAGPDTHDALRSIAAAFPVSFADRGADRVATFVQRKGRLLASLRRADAVVAPSRFLAGMFARNGFSHPRLEVVPYGLEPGRVTRVDVERPRRPLRVGFAGVLSPWKAPHVLVDAVRAVDGAIQATIHGRLEEPMFADYIADLRRRAGGDARIAFAGAFGRDDVGRVLGDLDVLVVPSTWYENTPFVVLEAQEAGVPVVASDLGGLAEVVTHGHDGYLFPAGDASALAELLRRCIAEPSMLTRLAPRPVAGIAGNFDRFERLYRGS